jgi:hypothetical protein
MPKNISKMKSINKSRHGPSVGDMKQIFAGGGPRDFILSLTDGLRGVNSALKYDDTDPNGIPKLMEQIKQRQKDIQESKDKHRGQDLQQRLVHEQLDQAKSIADKNFKQQASIAAANLREQRTFHGRLAKSQLMQTIQGLANKLWTNIAPYIALILVFIIVISFMKGGKGGKSGNNSYFYRIRKSITSFEHRAVNDIRKVERIAKKDALFANSWIHKKFNQILHFLDVIFNPLITRIKQYMNLFSGKGHSNVFDRQHIESGRCDNLNWIETTAEGTKGTCDNSIYPEALKWNLDTSKTPEFFELPQSRKSDMDKYSSVEIPWDKTPEASFYVPQCEKAYYPKTCNSSGICVQANMFEDLVLSCRAKDDKLPTQYPTTNDDVTITSFDDAGVKTCIDINSLTVVPCP